MCIELLVLRVKLRKQTKKKYQVFRIDYDPHFIVLDNAI